MFEIAGDFLIKLIPAVLTVYILKLYNDIFFEAKKISFPIFTIWFAYFIWQLFQAAQMIFPPGIKLMINVWLICLVSIIGYSGNLLQKIVVSLLVTAMWLLMEFIVGFLFTLLGWAYYTPLFCGSIISEIMILGLILALKRFFESENIRSLPWKYNMAILIIPVGSMYVLYNIFMISNIHQIYTGYVLQCLLSTIIILAIDIMVFKIYSSLAREKEIQRCNTVYEQQLNLCVQHMEEKELLLEEFRNQRHNYKQHFIVLNNLLSAKRIEEAYDYLNKLIDQKPGEKMFVCNTDNVVVDALINFKHSIAYSKGIKLTAKVQVPVRLPFSSADISILIGNILDNAIEAVENMPKEKKEICFYMQYNKNVLVIAEQNEYAGEIKKNKNGKILSEKGDDINHGIGLMSIEKIAHKYRGALVIETNNQVFKIKVTLIKAIVSTNTDLVT